MVTHTAAMGVVLLSISSLVAACGPRPVDRPGAANAMAWVNGIPVTNEDLELAVAGRHAEAADGNKAAVMQAVLENTIRLELQRQRAVKLGLDRRPEVSERLAKADAQYMAVLRNVLADAFVTHEVLPKAKVDDVALQSFVEAHADDLRMEYRLHQLRFKSPEEAEAAKTALAAGKSFEEVVAAAFPGLPAGGPKPEPITVRWSQLPEGVREAVSKLEPGQVSAVIPGAGKRYSIYQLVSKKVSNTVDMAAEKQVISGGLQQQRARELEQKTIDDLYKSATIKYGNKP